MTKLIIGGDFPVPRISTNTSTHYRLKTGPWGLFLQGWFPWQEGEMVGGEWRTIPTADRYDCDKTPPAGVNL